MRTTHTCVVLAKERNLPGKKLALQSERPKIMQIFAPLIAFARCRAVSEIPNLRVLSPQLNVFVDKITNCLEGRQKNSGIVQGASHRMPTFLYKSANTQSP